jgi:hypothetical protein
LPLLAALLAAREESLRRLSEEREMREEGWEEGEARGGMEGGGGEWGDTGGRERGGGEEL